MEKQWQEMLDETETLLTTSEKVVKIIYSNKRRVSVCNEYQIVCR